MKQLLITLFLGILLSATAIAVPRAPISGQVTHNNTGVRTQIWIYSPNCQTTITMTNMFGYYLALVPTNCSEYIISVGTNKFNYTYTPSYYDFTFTESQMVGLNGVNFIAQ